MVCAAFLTLSEAVCFKPLKVKSQSIITGILNPRIINTEVELCERSFSALTHH